MTTRQFKLMGDPLVEGVTGIVTIDGVEVFNGTFTGGPDEPEVEMCTGSIDIIDPTDGSFTFKPVSITVVSGRVLLGMFKWNYAIIPNPVYTPEQLAILSNPASTFSQRLEIYNLCASPAFNSAELALLQSTDPADYNLKIELLFNHNATPNVTSLSEFSYSQVSPTNTSDRINVLLNGGPAPDAETNLPVPMNTGDVLTFDTKIHPSILRYNL